MLGKIEKYIWLESFIIFENCVLLELDLKES